MLYHPVTIGNLTIPGNLFLAPVAGYSDRAFRSVCREGGANFAYTEMVSAEALVRGSDKTHQLMVRAANEDTYAVQLFGGTPEVMAQAVEQVLTQNDKEVVPEVIDINAGCPVPKITKTGAGSSLTRCPEQLYKVVAAAVSASSSLGDKQVPVTIKIRSGWDAQNMTWKEAALAAVEAGAAALTIHPRTRAQGYEGKSDWGILAELVELIQAKTQGKVPIFGSGDIFTPEDAQRMLQETGCQGGMFLLVVPWEIPLSLSRHANCWKKAPMRKLKVLSVSRQAFMNSSVSFKMQEKILPADKCENDSVRIPRECLVEADYEKQL